MVLADALILTSSSKSTFAKMVYIESQTITGKAANQDDRHDYIYAIPNNAKFIRIMASPWGTSVNNFNIDLSSNLSTLVSNKNEWPEVIPFTYSTLPSAVHISIRGGKLIFNAVIAPSKNVTFTSYT